MELWPRNGNGGTCIVGSRGGNVKTDLRRTRQRDFAGGKNHLGLIFAGVKPEFYGAQARGGGLRTGRRGKTDEDLALFLRFEWRQVFPDQGYDIFGQ